MGAIGKYISLGTINGDNTPPGFVGEYLESWDYQPFPLTGSGGNYLYAVGATLVLPPGDWDAQGYAYFDFIWASPPVIGPFIQANVYLSDSPPPTIPSPTLPDNLNTLSPTVFTLMTEWSLAAAPTQAFRYNVTVPTTLYLIMMAGTQTPSDQGKQGEVWGDIRARRIR